MNSLPATLGALLLVLAPVTSLAGSLADLATLPDPEVEAGYPGDAEVLVETIRAHWQAGRTVEAVRYAMYAPAGHDAAIVRWLLANLSGLSTPYYFLLSRKSFREAPEEAVFWHLVAGVNAFYDAGRCGMSDDGEEIQYLFSINRQAIAWKEVVRQRGELAPLLERAVAWLHAHPELPAPLYLCATQADADRAWQLRSDAVGRFETMLAGGGVPSASPSFRSLVNAVMEVRQDLLLARLSIENLAQADEVRNPRVIAWAQEVPDDLLREYLALSYLKFWDEAVAQVAYEFHASPLGQKMVRNAINQRLGLGGQYSRLTAADEAELAEWMSAPEMQRMNALRPAVLDYQGMLLRMAAGDPVLH